MLLLLFGMLVMFGSQDGRPPRYQHFEILVSRAERNWRQNPERWMEEMATVPDTMKKLHERARALSVRISAELEEMREEERIREENRFAEIQRRRSSVSSEPDTLRSLCLVFLEQHPASGYQPEVAAILDEANRIVVDRASRHPSAFRRELSKLLKKRNLGGAVRLVELALGNMREDLWREAGILEAWKKIQAAAEKELERTARETRSLSAEMAAAKYDELISQWGDGTLELLAPYCEKARKASGSIVDPY